MKTEVQTEKAYVFKYGQYWDGFWVNLPAYTAEVYPNGFHSHQLENGESYGVGSAGIFSVESGYKGDKKE